MRDNNRPLDPSPGWVTKDRHAAATLLWFAVGFIAGFVAGMEAMR